MPPVAHGAQYIYMDKSLLQQVQLGHHNEMSLVGDAGKHPSYSFSDSPPGMVASVTPQYLERTQKPEFLPGENHVAKLISAWIYMLAFGQLTEFQTLVSLHQATALMLEARVNE